MDILNLKSVLRKKLLIIFFSNPDKKYFVRQLSRLTGHSAGNISTELKKLNTDNLFIIEKTGGILFYQLNKNHPLYPDLKSIIFKTIGAEGGLREALREIPEIECAFIFGSFASGEERERSDIDLFVIGNPDTDELNDSIHTLEDLMHREINYHLYSKEDWIKKCDESNSFISNIIKKPKIFLIGGEECLKTT